MLGEDDKGRSLWDIEDEELAKALERFESDLSTEWTPDTRVDPVGASTETQNAILDRPV